MKQLECWDATDKCWKAAGSFTTYLEAQDMVDALIEAGARTVFRLDGCRYEIRLKNGTLVEYCVSHDCAELSAGELGKTCEGFEPNMYLAIRNEDGLVGAVWEIDWDDVPESRPDWVLL